MEKINKINEPNIENSNTKLLNKIFSYIKDRVANIVFISALSLNPVNASDNIWENYHDFLYWVESALKDIWILDIEQKYRAQLYYLYESIKNDSVGFKFRSDNDLLKWEFSSDSSLLLFIDKNDILKSENYEVFLKYWVSYREKYEEKKINSWISVWTNLNDINTKFEFWIINSNWINNNENYTIKYWEVVYDFNPENFPKIKTSWKVYNYNWENHHSIWIKTYYWNNNSFEGIYDSNKKDNELSVWVQFFLKLYKSWAELHTKIFWKKWYYSLWFINQNNVINQPKDTREWFEQWLWK